MRKLDLTDEERLERRRATTRKGQKKYKKTVKGKISEHKWNVSDKSKALHKKYYYNNYDKIKTHYAVSKALKSGALQKQPCTKCNFEIVQAHHPDYSKPLEVEWLCSEHHSKLHNQKYFTGGGN